MTSLLLCFLCKIKQKLLLATAISGLVMLPSSRSILPPYYEGLGFFYRS